MTIKEFFCKLANQRRRGVACESLLDSSDLLEEFHLEGLENRLMLAGNVTAVVNGDNLVIKGDSDANVIAVDAVAGNIVVIPLAGEAINGAVAAFNTGIAATDLNNLKINLKDGNDLALLGVLGTGMEVGGKLTVDTGAGNDIVLVSQLDVGRNLTIKTGAGDDIVSVSNTTVDGNAVVKTGKGADLVNIDVGSTFNGRAKVATDGGDDTLLVGLNGAVVFNGRAHAKMGGGDDVFLVSLGNVLPLSSKVAIYGNSGDDVFNYGFAVKPEIDGLKVKGFETFQ